MVTTLYNQTLNSLFSVVTYEPVEVQDLRKITDRLLAEFMYISQNHKENPIDHNTQ